MKSINCEACGIEISEDDKYVYRCRKCGYDFCKSCFKNYIKTLPKNKSIIYPACKSLMHVTDEDSYERTGIEVYKLIDSEYKNFKNSDEEKFIEQFMQKWNKLDRIRRNKKEKISYGSIICVCDCGGIITKPTYRCNKCKYKFCDKCLKRFHNGPCNQEDLELIKDFHPCPNCGKLYKHNRSKFIYCPICKITFNYKSGRSVIGNHPDIKKSGAPSKKYFGLNLQEILPLEDSQENTNKLYSRVIQEYPLFRYLMDLTGGFTYEFFMKYDYRVFIRSLFKAYERKDYKFIGAFIEINSMIKRYNKRYLELLSFLYYQDVPQKLAADYMCMVFIETVSYISRFIPGDESMRSSPFLNNYISTYGLSFHNEFMDEDLICHPVDEK